MTSTAYHLDMPQSYRSRVVFASPHSGRDYCAPFLKNSVLDEKTIRSSEDAFVDRLFACAPRYGAPLLRAGAPRAYLDLNRASDELDPALIEGVRKVRHNPRIASGLGVVPRVVANARPIYHGKLTRSEADTRIETIWRPYHAKLQALLTQALNTFGEAILLDCHSMPHEAVQTLAPGRSPEIVIGDRFGASASPVIVEKVEAVFADAGLRVARNAPFAGAFTTQHYGRPSRRQHAVQIEIDRSLYMDEGLIRPNANFDAFCALLQGVVGQLADLSGRDSRLAAE